ncbi:MAG: hypothetical protein E5X53_33470 [Mesorhizobium sp.]|uniref:NAD(P)/FAD-dependent oxidoreductase n=1 Tax=Mesorhizobium sp. TaxID=1871066 RepID=UPI0012174538|nr:FAD-dependent oxidoreductase [Mesorhizobium sp.]TIR47569.1 MAG: hypothetical protein E5X53_33470 [Mesorhizobium sp.]
MFADHTIAIIGGGHAGVEAAAALRRFGYSGKLFLLDSQDEEPYARPPLSKELLLAKQTREEIKLRKASFYSEHSIGLLLKHQVQSLDIQAKRIVVGEREPLRFDRVLLATGAVSRRIDVRGNNLPGIFEVRTVKDALALREAFIPSRNVVVVGAGYIGLEVAAAARSLGLNVTVIERDARIMSRVASPTISQFLQSLHEENGVQFVLQQSVAAFEGDNSVTSVVTSSGLSFPADVVVIGIGVVANDDLAARAGLICRDGVLVDGLCQTSSPSVFAAGDVTRHENRHFKNPMRLECVQNAASQAIIAARSMLHLHVSPYDEVPWFWTSQYGCRVQSAGIREQDDEPVVRGNVASGKFSVVYLRRGTVVAIDCVGTMKDFTPGKRLITQQQTVQASAVKDPNTALHDLGT